MAAYIGVIGAGAQPATVMETEVTAEDADIVRRYHLDTYDDDEDVPPPGVVAVDPYLAEAVAPEAADEDEEGRVKPTDLLLMVGKTGDQIPSMEVHLFDAEQESLFVHHELMIPSFPLNIRWLDFTPMTGEPGSFAAISTFETFIEIWDMNVIEPMAPAATLQFHTQPVPGIAWNVMQRGLLLSASIDTRAALWSLDRCQPAVSFEIGAPCKACEWCPTQESVFCVATEQGAAVYEARQPAPVYQVMGGMPIETIAWSVDGEFFFTGDMQGAVTVFNTKNPQNPVTRLAVHEKAITSLSVCKCAPIIATVGEDGFCRLVRLDNGTLVPFAEEKVGVQLYASSFCPDRPTLLAMAGEGEEAQLWDIANLLTRTE